MEKALAKRVKLDPVIKNFLHEQDEQIRIILEAAREKLEAQPYRLSKAKALLIYRHLREIPVTIYWRSQGLPRDPEGSWRSKGLLRDPEGSWRSQGLPQNSTSSNRTEFRFGGVKMWRSSGTLKEVNISDPDFYTALYSAEKFCEAVDSPIRVISTASYGFPLPFDFFQMSEKDLFVH